MTLKPNYLRAIAIVYGWIGLFSAIAAVLGPTKSASFAWSQFASVWVVGGPFMATAA